MHDALLGTAEGDRVRCGLCPHNCLIVEADLGYCGARGVVDGRLRALTYGEVSSLAEDPIEKKPVFHFRPGTRVFSVGGVGCSMRCGHCQNHLISARDAGEHVRLRHIEPDALVRMAVESGCEGIAWTYNEPVIWLEYVLDCARLAREAGLYTVMVTNGYVTPEALAMFARDIDVWRVDIKGFSARAYRDLCHVAHPEAVRQAAVLAKNKYRMHVECVTNVVPTINDSDQELRAIADWIVGELGPETPWHVTRFVPYLKFAHLDPTPLSVLERARAIGQGAGLHYVYMGNVDVEGGEDTVCPKCGETVVVRRGYSTTITGLDDTGRCERCGTDQGIRLS